MQKRQQDLRQECRRPPVNSGLTLNDQILQSLVRLVRSYSLFRTFFTAHMNSYFSWTTKLRTISSLVPWDWTDVVSMSKRGPYDRTIVTWKGLWCPISAEFVLKIITWITIYRLIVVSEPSGYATQKECAFTRQPADHFQGELNSLAVFNTSWAFWSFGRTSSDYAFRRQLSRYSVDGRQYSLVWILWAA